MLANSDAISQWTFPELHFSAFEQSHESEVEVDIFVHLLSFSPP